MARVYLEPHEQAEIKDDVVHLCVSNHKYRLIYQQRDNFVILERTHDHAQVRYHITEIMHDNDIIKELPADDAFLLGVIAGSEVYHPTEKRFIEQGYKRKSRRGDFLEWENIPHLGRSHAAKRKLREE